MRRLCLKAINQAEAEAVARGLSQYDTENLAEETVALIDSAYTAVRAYQSIVKEPDPTRLWLHQDMLKTITDGRSALGHWDVGKDQLIEISRGLMDRPWLRVDEFEWVIVDALTFREVFEFGETVKTPMGSFTEGWAHAAAGGNLRRLPWQRLKAYAVSWTVRWGLLAAGMWVTWVYITKGDYSDWPSIWKLTGAFALLFYLLIAVPVGKKAVRLQKQQQAKLLDKMGVAYATLRQGDLLSPNQIRAALLAAQDNGAVWDAAIFALLDRAAQRDPPVWAL